MASDPENRLRSLRLPTSSSGSVPSLIRPYLPQQQSLTPRKRQLVEALKQLGNKVSDAGTIYGQQMSQDEMKAGSDAALGASEEDRKQTLEKMRKGEITERDNKYWRMGFAGAVLRDNAKEYGKGIALLVNENQGKPGFDLKTTINQARRDYITYNGLEGVNASVMQDNFHNPANTYENQVSQRHTETTISEERSRRIHLATNDLLELSEDDEFNSIAQSKPLIVKKDIDAIMGKLELEGMSLLDRTAVVRDFIEEIYRNDENTDVDPIAHRRLFQEIAKDYPGLSTHEELRFSDAMNGHRRGLDDEVRNFRNENTLEGHRTYELLTSSLYSEIDKHPEEPPSRVMRAYLETNAEAKRMLQNLNALSPSLLRSINELVDKGGALNVKRDENAISDVVGYLMKTGDMPGSLDKMQYLIDIGVAESDDKKGLSDASSLKLNNFLHDFKLESSDDTYSGALEDAYTDAGVKFERFTKTEYVSAVRFSLLDSLGKGELDGNRVDVKNKIVATYKEFFDKFIKDLETDPSKREEGNNTKYNPNLITKRSLKIEVNRPGNSVIDPVKFLKLHSALDDSNLIMQGNKYNRDIIYQMRTAMDGSYIGKTLPDGKFKTYIDSTLGLYGIYPGSETYDRSVKDASMAMYNSLPRETIKQIQDSINKASQKAPADKTKTKSNSTIDEVLSRGMEEKPDIDRALVRSHLENLLGDNSIGPSKTESLKIIRGHISESILNAVLSENKLYSETISKLNKPTTDGTTNG